MQKIEIPKDFVCSGDCPECIGYKFSCDDSDSWIDLADRRVRGKTIYICDEGEEVFTKQDMKDCYERAIRKR